VISQITPVKHGTGVLSNAEAFAGASALASSASRGEWRYNPLTVMILKIIPENESTDNTV